MSSKKVDPLDPQGPFGEWGSLVDLPLMGTFLSLQILNRRAELRRVALGVGSQTGERRMEICDPVQLARLPKPFSSAGKVHFGPVWGLRNRLKRKRHELCAAVDGDSVNIHSVQTGQILFSQAVPPQTSFVTAPVSVRWVEDGTAFRQICFVVQDDGLYLRSVVTEGAKAGNQVSEASLELKNPASSVVHLDIVETANKRTILAIQDDGTVTTAASNLSDASSSLLTTDSGARHSSLLAACCLSMDEASKSALKGRRDIANGLPDTSIIVTAFGIKNATNPGASKQPFYSTWSLLSDPVRHFGTDSSIEIRRLFEHDLSSSCLPFKVIGHSAVSFGSRASSLDIKTDHGCVRFKLSGTAPTKLPSPQSGLGDYSDILPLSPINLFIAYPNSLQILDANYEILQANLDLNQASARLKRRQSGSRAPGGRLELLKYFSQLQRVVARKGNSLVAIDLRFGEKRIAKEAGASRLADNIGRGHRLPVISKVPPLSLEFARTSEIEQGTEGWCQEREKLEAMVGAKNIRGFQTAVLGLLKASTKVLTPEQSSQGRASNIPAAGLDSIIDFVLTRMFSVAASATFLQLNFEAPLLIKWLSSGGYLCTWRVKKALRSTANLHSLEYIEVGSISRAIYNADKSSELLFTHLKQNSDPDLDELVCTVKFLISRLLAEAEGRLQDLKAIEEPSHEANVSGELHRPVDIDLGDAVFPPAFFQAFILSLNRLGVRDDTSLSTSLRRFLSKKELRGLVQFLRQQLFQGGHAGSLVLSSSAVSENGLAGPPATHTLQAKSSTTVSFESIVKILSACLDAVGPLGLLDTEVEDESVENIIPDLLSEIKLSAQYIEESAELQGILRETLRYSQSRDSETRKDGTKPAEGGRTAQNFGDIITVYSEEAEDEEVNGLAGALPLSHRDESLVDPVKVRKGGGQVSARSTRETLMLEGRRKGPYNFERLIL